MANVLLKRDGCRLLSQSDTQPTDSFDNFQKPRFDWNTPRTGLDKVGGMERD